MTRNFSILIFLCFHLLFTQNLLSSDKYKEDSMLILSSFVTPVF